jgi:hypothetical protein
MPQERGNGVVGTRVVFSAKAPVGCQSPRTPHLPHKRYCLRTPGDILFLLASMRERDPKQKISSSDCFRFVSPITIADSQKSRMTKTCPKDWMLGLEETIQASLSPALPHKTNTIRPPPCLGVELLPSPSQQGQENGCSQTPVRPV